ncbi:transcription termination factor Rho [Francisella sp. W12-1067]|nr:transcription termination factor Rho [Francisella sp. W12-1067]
MPKKLKFFSDMEDVQAMEFLTEKMKGTITKKDFFETIKRSTI